jgi:hypothetical protein
MTSNKLNNAVALTVLALAVAVTLMPDLAFAQGQGQAVVDYAYTEYAVPMLNAGVIAAAVLMFFLRFSFSTIGTVAAGGLTLANYDAITGLFGV